jgi:Probable Zinc-ribbon domain
MCSGRVATPQTSFAALHPKVAAQWHPTRNGSLLPEALRPGSNRRAWWQCPANEAHVWVTTLARRTKGSGCPFCSRKATSPELSLAALRPEIAREWHPTKNGKLAPTQVVPGSSKKVWWRCRSDRAHSWQASVANRTRLGRGCPYCAHQCVSATTSLARRKPRLAAEWHPTKNEPLRARDVLPGSNKPVWWRCRHDPTHEWRATVASRGLRGTGCPACAGKIATPSTSFAARHPRLAREWHPTKNGRLKPDDVVPGSQKRVHWRCSKDASHEWTATVTARAHGSRCPICSSIVVQCPELACEWHPTKNRPLRPEQVSPGSGRRVWWRCAKDPSHLWRAAVSNRALLGVGCAMCSGKVATPTTSLKALYPELAREWHPTKNGTLRPTDVRPGSGKRVWWRCRFNPYHEWETRVYNRARRKSGCPDCHRGTPRKKRRRPGLRVPILI